MPEVDASAASIDVALPTALFSLEAAKRAAYVLMARATIAFEVSDKDIGCKLMPVNGVGRENLERDFRREVLDQQLRIEIETRTEPMRNAILGLTFSQTGLQG